MGLVKKIFKIFSLVFFALYISSCEQGCVESDQFSSEFSTVQSYPVADGVYGFYDPVEGGQRAQWHSAGFRSNGEPMVIKITGAWTAWYGDSMSAAKMSQIPSCRICAKSKNRKSDNCVCGPNENPVAETMTLSGLPSTALCQTLQEQNNPELCSCTKDPAQGYTSSVENNMRQPYSDIYYFSLDALDKNENPRIADRQQPCKFEKGMGLYIGLFGASGFVTPKNVYPLYTLEKGCEITTNNSKCIDENGDDRTFYLYRSPNNRTFIKDDHDNNDGSDTNSENDEYHKPNEQVKLLIFDRYYADNFGQYHVEFLGGVGSADKKGLIEFIVNLFEDVVLGKVNDDGLRDGGVIKSMYNSIVHDSGFAKMMQILLSLYIAIYGFATLIGVAELNKKELLSRVVKISLVMLFTSKDSWNMYNDLVVRFFKDGMDYVVSMMMSISDSNVTPSSMILTAQEDRVASYSNATRFSYVDLMIKKMLSAAVAKKVFGLFFGTYPPFSLIYIIAIYLLIAFFIYVMIFVAMIYLTNILKIIFALALGPIFMCFTLFSHTNQMFKNWLAFVGARSLEIILVFMVLYNFLVLIDKQFNALLSFRTCAVGFDIIPGILPVRVLKSYVPTHSPMYWFSSLVVIGGFIFMTKLIVEKIADLAGELISIGGVDNKDGDDVGRGKSGFAMAGAMAGEIGGAIKDGAMKVGKFAGRHGIEIGTAAARKSGLAEKWNNMGKAIPFRGIRSRARDSVVDSAIKKARSEGMSKGFSGKALDQHIRSQVTKTLGEYMYHNPKEAALKGVNMSAAAERMDKVLLEQPLKQFLKDTAKKMKEEQGGDLKIGKDFRQALRAKAREWADKNTNVGASGLDKFFGVGKDTKAGFERSKFDKEGDRGMRNLVRSLSEIAPEDAARKLHGNAAKQQEYQKMLDEKDYRKHKLDERANKTYFGQGVNMLKNAAKAVTRSTKYSTDLARKSLARNLEAEKSRNDGFAERKKGFMGASKHVGKVLVERMGGNVGKGWNPLGRVKMLDRAADSEFLGGERKYEREADKKQRESLLGRLRDDKKLSPEKRAFFEGQLGELARKPIKELAENMRKTDEYKKVERDFAEKKDLESRLKQVDESIKKFVEKFGDRASLRNPGQNVILSQLEKEKAECEARKKHLEDELKKDNRKNLEKIKAESEVLINDKDRTLSEKLEMLKELKAMGLDTSKEIKDITEEIKKDFDKKTGELEKLFADGKVLEAEKSLTDEDKKDGKISFEDYKNKVEELKSVGLTTYTDEERKAAQATDLIPTGMEVKFGASITDALLKASDIGLKAGSIALGIDPAADDKEKAAKKSTAEAKKQEIEMREKVAKMNKKIKEMEIATLEAEIKGTGTDAQRAKLAALSKEHKDLDSDLRRFENDAAAVDSEIKANT